MSIPVYRIRNWDTIYENNRTREVKEMKWIPLPVKLDGDGYTLIVEKKNGAAIFGAFVALLELASQCDPRGTLIRANGIPHDQGSISRILRMQAQLINEMLLVCLNECKWLELLDLSTGATMSQESAGKSQEPATLYCNVMLSSVVSSNVSSCSENGKVKVGKHLFKNSPYYEYQKFRAQLEEWSDDQCRDYWERANDYSEQHNAKYANWIAAVKNWARKDRVKQSPKQKFGRQDVSMSELKNQAERVHLQ